MPNFDFDFTKILGWPVNRYVNYLICEYRKFKIYVI